MVSHLRQQFAALITAGDVRISEHGYDALADDGLTVDEILVNASAGVVVEEYPEYPKGAAVLVLRRAIDGQRRSERPGIPDALEDLHRLELIAEPPVEALGGAVSHHRENTGIATTGCFRRITGSGKPSCMALAIGNVGMLREAVTGEQAVGGRLTRVCCDMTAKPRSHETSRIAWAKLMARVGEEFPLECPNSGGDIRLIAFRMFYQEL